MTSTATELIAICRSLYERGLTPGTTGNVSVQSEYGLLITPTGKCMGRLSTTDLALVSRAGVVADGAAPSKELNLHIAAYRRLPTATAVVHLHSPHATAVSCLAGISVDDALGSLTGYHAIKVGKLAKVAYHPPGSAELVAAVDEGFADADALLLANHGSLVASRDLESAADAAEQIEQSAHIYLLVGGRPINPVSARRQVG